MGKAKKTRKFAEVKRLLHPKELAVYVISSPGALAPLSRQHIIPCITPSTASTTCRKDAGTSKKKQDDVKHVYVPCLPPVHHV
jgi:hypothetical protein